MNHTQFHTVDYKLLLEREREITEALWKYRKEWLKQDAFQWVHVKSGKLPEPNDDVLVFWRELDNDGTPSCIGVEGEGGMMSIGFWDQHCKCFVLADEREPRVTHWRPMPVSPWQMKESDGEVYQ
jgi:hypothetical protein